MSYKIANITDAMLYGGPFKPTHVPASIRITDIILDTLNEINIDDVFEVEALEERIHQTLVIPIKSDALLYILSDYYKANSQITVYLNQSTNLVLCGTCVINFYPTDTSLPTKDDVEVLWKCGLKAPSSEYYLDQLVRREDLLPKSQSVLEQSVKLYYNSVYTNVIVENRGVCPNISENDVDYTQSYMSTSYQTCNSYITCKPGDLVTITINSSVTNYDAYLYNIVYLLKNMDGEDQLVPLADGFEILGKYSFSFIVPSNFPALSSEYFITLWVFDKKRLVTGSWINVPESFSDGSIPVYTIDLANDSGNLLYVFYKKEGADIISSSFGATCGDYLYIQPSVSGVVEGTFSDITVSVTTESGRLISTQMDALGRYTIIMPEEKCHITVTAGLILDLSIVFSGSFEVEEVIYWDNQSLLLSEIELICHVDEDMSFIPRQVPTGNGNTMLHIFDDILIKQYMWSHPSEELLATLYVQTQKLYEYSIKSIRTTKLTDQIQILSNSPGDICPDSINYVHRIILRSESTGFYINMIIKIDQYNKIKLEFLGEPFIIKTTEPRLDIRPLKRLITAETDWGWEYPEYPGIAADQFGELTRMGDTTLNLDVYYHCFTPYSNVSQVPTAVEYGTIFLGGDKLNHSFYSTVTMEVARHSELYLPSTITTVYQLSFLYAGFKKISIPGLAGTIPLKCFMCNWYLQEFVVPPSVTTISSLAFAGAGSSTEEGCNIDFGNVSTIEYGALANSKLPSLTLPESLKNIDNVSEYYGYITHGCDIETLYWNATKITNNYDGYPLGILFSGQIYKTLKTIVIGENVEYFPDFRFVEFRYNMPTIIDKRQS